jgi:competence protein CoiA
VEANLGPIVADVYAVISGNPVAIEVQKSNVSVNEIIRRTIEYYKLGINVLWLSLFNNKLNEERYSPSAWEKWCHAAYLGRVYYWLADLIVIPFHFADYQLYVEESTWYEPGGYERSEGGYYKTSKRYRTPFAGHKVDIAINFSPNQKQAWSGGSVDIPTRQIYLDNQKTWWKKA